MEPQYDPSWLHDKIAEALMRVERGEIKRLLITMPPRHGKSMLASQYFPAWYLGRNPTKEIIMASYSGELASDFGRKVRNIVDEPDFQACFNVKLAEDSKAKNRWHTNKKGGYVAAGVGGAITGRGADILLIDDPFKDREEAESQVIRDKVYDWYTSTAITRLTPNGAVVIIHTRWHDDDLIGRILAKEPEKWEHLNFPATAEEDEEFRKRGDPLWPQRYSYEALMNIKNSVGPYDWACLFQQNPINEETQEFKKSFFKYYRETDLPPGMRIITAIDPAISKKETADDSVVFTVGVMPSITPLQIIGGVFLLEYTAGKMNPSELIDEIFFHHSTWNSDLVIVETVAYQEALAHFLREQMMRTGQMLNIEEVKHSVDKERRIRGLIPYYKSGLVFHRPGMSELEQQLLRFPKAAHDDIIDALALTMPFWLPPIKKAEQKPKGESLRRLMEREGILNRAR